MYKQISENDTLMSSIKPFLGKGEVVKVSEKLKYKDKLYREIRIEKKQFIGSNGNAEGYIYIGENGEIVKDKTVQKELARMGYYYGTFFNEDRRTSIIKALKKEGALNRDSNDYEEIGKALELLSKEEKIREAESMKITMAKVLNIRLFMNEEINEFAEYINSVKEADAAFDEEVLEKAYMLFENVMKANFDNIKAIAEISEYADRLKDIAKKKRKKIINRFNSKITSPLFKLDYQLAYYKRIIATYAKVINMNTSQYMKFFRGNQTSHIDERFNMIRR